MVAVLVGLKLRLLRNALRQSVWRVVGLVLALAHGVFLVGLAIVGLVALRFTQVDVGPDVVVVGLMSANGVSAGGASSTPPDTKAVIAKNIAGRKNRLRSVLRVFRMPRSAKVAAKMTLTTTTALDLERTSDAIPLAPSAARTK